jgi:hypothetical protein
MVDRELLSKIENDMPSYMANSPARVREFLGVWERHCNETITLVKGVEGVEDLMRDETESLWGKTGALIFPTPTQYRR